MVGPGGRPALEAAAAVVVSALLLVTFLLRRSL
jgi:hypothetical protein